jgi:hypothetical protein
MIIWKQTDQMIEQTELRIKIYKGSAVLGVIGLLLIV